MIDPRGPRFSAAITALAIVTALVVGPAWGWIPLVLQLGAFGLGTIAGLRYQPYGIAYRRFLAPLFGPPVELEDPRPPRFAQFVGLIFVALALIGVITGIGPLFYVAASFALAASFLNAAFDFCLGCELWLAWQRIRGRVVVRRVGA